MATNDAGKVVIEVVLDDGQTKKFFAQLQQDAKTAGDQAGKKAKGLSQIFDPANAEEFKTELLAAGARIAGVTAIAAAAGLAIKKAFDFALQGEQIAALEKTFDRIASSQGLGNLRAQLEGAGAGLVDVGDILNDASQAMLNLGATASQLPQLLQVAVESARLFGGTAEERFSTLTRAVETGNARLLRTQGIIVDTDKVFGDYAQRLGLLAGELTLAQKQQALLNEVLAEGNKRSKAGGESVQPLADAYKTLAVAVDDFQESMLKSISESIGPFFTAIINGAAAAVQSLNQMNKARSDGFSQSTEGAAQLRAQILNTEQRVKSLQGLLANMPRANLNNFDEVATSTTRYRRELKTLQDLLPQLQKQFKDMGATIMQDGVAAVTEKETKKLPQLTAEQIAAIQSRNAQIIQLQNEGTQAFLASEQTRLETTQINDQVMLERKMLLGQQLIAMGQQQELALQQAEQQFSAARGFTLEQREAARVAIIQKYNAQAVQKTIEGNNQINAAYQKSSEQIRSTIQAGVVNSVQAGLESVGRSLQQGAMDWQDFGAGIGGVVGDMAITLGRGLIAQGLALEAFIAALNSLLPGSGFAAAAVGAGLVIFGSALKSSVQGRSSGGGSSPSLGGFQPGTPGGDPITTMPVTETPVAETMATSESPQTAVVVQIQGDVLDSDETGLRIVELINSAFDKQGVVVKRGAIA